MSMAGSSSEFPASQGYKPRELGRSTSGIELMGKLPGVNLLLYDDLKKFDSIESLIRKHKLNIILYQTSAPGDDIYGHWVALFENPAGGVEFFDSYGVYPDDEISRTIYSGCPHCDYLTQLLLDYMDRGGEVEYNDYPLQAPDPNIATCGKHVVIRMLNQGLSIDDYKKELDQLKKVYGTYDKTVNELYNNI